MFELTVEIVIKGKADTIEAVSCDFDDTKWRHRTGRGTWIDEGADGVIQIEKSVTKIQIFTGPS